MIRIAHKSKDFREAENWEKQEAWKMSPDQRFAIAKALQEKVYGIAVKDVREWHRNKR